MSNVTFVAEWMKINININILLMNILMLINDIHS